MADSGGIPIYVKNNVFRVPGGQAGTGAYPPRMGTVLHGALLWAQRNMRTLRHIPSTSYLRVMPGQGIRVYSSLRNRCIFGAYMCNCYTSNKCSYFADTELVRQ